MPKITFSSKVKLDGLKGVKNYFNKSLRDDMQAIKKRRVQGLKEGAPNKTGSIASRIRGRVSQERTPEGKNINITISLPPVMSDTGFPYSHWVTNQEGYKYIRPREGNRFFLAGQKVAYGDGSMSPGHRGIVWTGSPGFWQAGERLLEQNMKRLERKIKKKVNK